MLFENLYWQQNKSCTTVSIDCFIFEHSAFHKNKVYPRNIDQQLFTFQKRIVV